LRQTCEGRACISNFTRHFDNHFRLDTGFVGGELGSVLSVGIFKNLDEGVKCLRLVRMLFAQVLFPVDPLAHELAVERIFLQQNIAHRQQDCGLAAGP
jgi:hypothetical protein